MPVVRNNYNHFSADILYTNRYLIDSDEEIHKELIRLCYIDIETTSLNTEGNDAILTISVYDSFNKNYIAFCYKKSSLGNVKVFGSEYDMLNGFIDYIKETDPDILISWYGVDFDFPYLINRMKVLGLNYNKLSRLNKTIIGRNVKIYGRILFDLLKGYEKIYMGGRESYSLEYISKYELKEKGGKEAYKVSLIDLYNNDIDRFLSYNLRDVELMVLLNENLKIVEYFDDIRRYARCNFLDVIHNSSVFDNLFLTEAKKLNLVLPSKPASKKEVQKYKKIEGAFVYQPIKKLFENVACLDIKSLYPSIAVSFNTSPETKLKSYQENCIDVDGKFYFTKNFEGIVPKVITKLLNQRVEYKNLKLKYLAEKGVDSDEYKTYKSLDFTIKTLLASFYGVIAYRNFRLYDKDIAETITYIGRQILNFTIDYLNNKGIKIIYADTDSIFFLKNNLTISEIEILVNSINSSYINFVKKYNIINHIFVIEFEKIYETIFFSGVKKRYAGKVVYQDRNKTNYIDIVGFESVRSDSPQVIRDFQKNLFTLILNKTEKTDVDNFINDFIVKVRNMRSELGIPCGINKEKYKNTPIHIRAVNRSNNFHNTNFGFGDKIKYVYVKTLPNGNLSNSDNNVIAFFDELYDGYEIDYDKMIDRLIINKVNDVYEGLNWQINIQNKQKNIFNF